MEDFRNQKEIRRKSGNYNQDIGGKMCESYRNLASLRSSLLDSLLLFSSHLFHLYIKRHRSVNPASPDMASFTSWHTLLFSSPCNGLVWMQVEAVDLWMVGQRALDPHGAFWINNGCFSVLLLLMSECTYVEHSSCVFCRNVKGTGYRRNTEARRQGIQFRIRFLVSAPLV